MVELLLRPVRRVLALPEGNPPIPAGAPASVVVWNPGPGYLTYRLLGWMISLAFTIVFLGAVAAGARHLAANAPSDFPRWLPWAGLAAISVWTLAGLAWRFLAIRLELDMLRYTLTDRAVRLRRGVREVRELTISFVNVQNVRFEQGPLQRFCGIGDLVIDVAGGGAVVAGGHPQAAAASLHEGRLIGVGEPRRLQETVLARVKAARGAGLGDDPSEERAGAGLDAPAARALLAEIRDGIAAARVGLERG